MSDETKKENAKPESNGLKNDKLDKVVGGTKASDATIDTTINGFTNTLYADGHVVSE